MSGEIPARRIPGLSKSRVMLGLQCHKRLWWTLHEPDAPELQPSASVEAILDGGSRVGELARTYVPGGILIDAPHDAFEARLAATQAALDAGAPAIYEASFRADRIFVAVDILERDGAAFRLIEVKATMDVHGHHLQDVAIQAHVLGRNGIPLTRLEVMHFNRECTAPDLSRLFVREDVTAAVEPLLATIGPAAEAQAAMLAGPLPDILTGPHCEAPYACPFIPRCWPALPPHHLSTLYGLRRRAAALGADGVETIHDLPEDVSLPRIAARQRRAVQSGRVVVEPGLGEALRAFSPPIAFLDFETVAPAIPLWPGCRPYEAVPAQFSCHVLGADGALVHHEWLAQGPEDPRPALAEPLLAACAGARAVVAYSAGFERRCLEQMGRCLPDRAPGLHGIADRLVDLLPVIRNHVYHPDFGGSFSLKQVLPALVPDLAYDGLAIADGSTASAELARLMVAGETMPAADRQSLRTALLAYCRQDTLGLVRLLEHLRQLAAT